MPAENYKKVQVSLDNTPTTIYTPPANAAGIFKSVFGINIAGTTTTVRLWQGGTANANLILAPTDLQTGESFSGSDGTIVVGAGDTLSGQCSQVGGVVLTLEGVEVPL